MKFTVTHELTAEQISDALCSAIEGGSNYWYSIDRAIEPSEWQFDSEPQRDGQHWLHDYPLNPGGALLMSDTTEDNEHGTMRLDSESIQRGLTVLAEKYSWHMQDILQENADADTGDALLQCCLFGEIIYG
jgi:hypothetical protein